MEHPFSSSCYFLLFFSAFAVGTNFCSGNHKCFRRSCQVCLEVIFICLFYHFMFNTHTFDTTQIQCNGLGPLQDHCEQPQRPKPIMLNKLNMCFKAYTLLLQGALHPLKGWGSLYYWITWNEKFIHCTCDVTKKLIFI